MLVLRQYRTKRRNTGVLIRASHVHQEKSRVKNLKFIGDESNVAIYVDSIVHSKKLGSEEERALAERIGKGDMRAMNILVNANLKFVIKVCRNYRNQGLPFGDLINEGNLGLIRAAQRFDATKDCRFISYAVWWIRQGILVALSEQTRFLKITPSRVHAVRRAAKASQKLEQQLGRAPLIEEIAAVLDLKASKLTEYMQLAAKSVSLNTPTANGGPGLEDTLEDMGGARTDDGAMELIMRKSMANLLGSLDERKAMVLRLYYGIGSNHPMSLSEIAAKLNLTRERVRQIKADAISLLRRPARIKLAGSFYG